ncbi:pyrroline-5-carboxylate reductase, partial [Xanthomonas oryzae pv. oryzae]
SPIVSSALRLIRPVPRTVLSTAQVAADRAGRTLQCFGDRAHRHPGFM